MKHEIIIGVSIVVAIVVLLGLKMWLHRLLKFKMDESSILNFFKDSAGHHTYQTTETISAGTDLGPTRVSQVCVRSKAIKANTKEKESWCLNHAENV